MGDDDDGEWLMKKRRIKADAILWDFDGTLADSTAKNYNITLQILDKVAPHLTGGNLPRWLQNKTNYHEAIQQAENWRDLYRDFFGMALEDIQAAGPMWEDHQEDHQAQDNTEITLYDGILETISELADIPMGISSANSSYNINRALNNHGIISSFRSVVGYEKFSPEAQKPAAEPGMQCLEEVLEETHGKTIIYVGDHVADVIFSRNIADRLGPSSTVISVAVTYSGADPESWRIQPDEVIEAPAELADWIRT
jgi:phosphoglycolate phosphatase-like HAD superfamily hydrolase